MGDSTEQTWGSVKSKILLYDGARERKEDIDNGDSAKDGEIVVLSNEE